MRVTAERDRCVGSGQCALLSPEVFDQDDDGLVVVLREEPAEELRGEVFQAADLCPARSIRVHG
ncbi:ferredoxin [Streptomyces sp. 5-8]|uniref:Ferredoxin n=1 Tax=Streptomyces musisoli TaxID=2802280 RepID=A0ABS1PD33_9ACTN|nr:MULTISPECIES: ferredoxin [Streptomyces]MBL1110300.1 ferredoxin [Streptomyces musisoli]MBY8841328.1 ferredoxin [Streptomyces sp. SP2-10]